MISASKEFKEKLKKGANVVNYADFTLSDGTVLHLEPKDFMISGCSIEDKTTDGKFGVGFVIGKTCTLRIANHDERFSQYDFYNSIVNLHVALALDNGTVEKIRKGVYYTLVPETPGDVIEISAVDGMYQLDRDYADSTTAYPATLQTIISQACTDCGIPIGFRQFDNMSFVVQTKPENVTYRQVVSYVCQIAGYNARIDNDGYMQLVWYNTSMLDWYNYDGGDFKTYPHNTILDGGNFTNYGQGKRIDGGLFTDKMPDHIFQIKNLTVSTDDVQITGIKVIGEEDTSVLFGEEGYAIEVKNPFAVGKENEVANYLGNRIVGMLFRPFGANILNNPLYEPFDVVRISDRKGNVYISIINVVSYKIGGFTTISCQAEDPVRNGTIYFSDAAQAVVEARRNSEKQITEYDKAVQNMNQIAMNAMGFHTTFEDQPDGSRIVYLHDKPLLEDSKIIYKQSIDGFFISEDGGKSYAAGFDKNGNVVVNVLYAIGIVADWIRTGRFAVHKGNQTTFLADADTGEVRIVADSFSLSSGKTINDVADEVAKEYYTSLNVDINGISTNVSRLEGDVNTKYSALDTKITQTAGSIKLEASELYTTKTELDSAKKTLNSSIETKGGEILATVSGIYEKKTDAATKYSSFETRITANEKGLQSTVKTTDYTGAKIASLINQSADTVKIAAKNINLTGNDIANKINNSDTTIKLSANKINLTAYSTTEQINGKLNNYATTTYTNNQIASCVKTTDYNGNTIASKINQTATTIQIKAENIDFSATNTTINGIFNNVDGIKTTKIESGIVKGYRSGIYSGLLDLSAVYSDGRKHAALRAFDDLHLQGRAFIYFEMKDGDSSPTQKGRISASGWYFESDIYAEKNIHYKSPAQVSGLRYIGVSGSGGQVYAVANSSMRVKDILKPLSASDADKLYDITPVWAKYKDGYLDDNDERNGIYYPMLIAEDLQETVPLAVNHDAEGRPDDWNVRVIIPLIMQVLKNQKNEIEQLKENLI